MTPSQKPEWIEITDQDNAAFTRKISKGLPIIALAVTASILGMGNLFAQGAEGSPANAIEITAPAAPISQSSDPSTTTVATQSIETQNSDEAINPSIGTLPTVGEEDDSDDEVLGDDDDDDADGVLGYDGDDDEGDDD